MAYTTFTAYIETTAGEFEIELDVEGHVYSGGSNSYGSDEPAYTEVEDVTITPSHHKRLGKRTLAAIEAHYWDAITEALIEADSGW